MLVFTGQDTADGMTHKRLKGFTLCQFSLNQGNFTTASITTTNCRWLQVSSSL